MKTFWIILIAVILVGFIFFAVVKPKPEEAPTMPAEEMTGQLSILPDSAFIVVVFDIPEIQQKMDLPNIRFNKDKTQILNILSSLDIAGIDQNRNACLFGTASGDNALMGVSCTLMDPEMFKNVLNTAAEIDSIRQRNGYQYAILEEEEVWIGWNDANAVAIGIPDDSEEYSIIKAGESNDVMNLLDAMFTREGDSRILEDRKFSELLTHGGDIRMWMNIRYLPIPDIPWQYSDIFDLRSLKHADNYVNAVMNFENGKLTAESWYNFSDSLKAFQNRYAKLEKKGVDPALIDHLSLSEEPMLLMSGAIDFPAFLRTIVEDLQKSDEYAGVITLGMLYITKFGITFDNIYDAFAGDMIMAMTKIDKNNPEQVTFLKINDRESLDKIMKAVGSSIIAIEQRDGYSAMQYDGDYVYYKIDDDVMIFTVSENIMKNVVANPGKTSLSQPTLDAMKTMTNFTRIDLGTIFDYILDEDIEKDDRIWVEAFQKALGDVEYRYVDQKANLAVTMKDPSKNSLHQLVQAIVTASEE